MLDGNEIQSILDDFRRIVRVLRESSRASERDVGLSAAQLFVLNALADESALSLNELAARTHTHQSSVSVVVKRLAERDLVVRKPSSRDGRRLELSLTEKGRALVSRAPGAPQQRLVDAAQRLTPIRRHELAVSLADLVQAMGIEDRTPSMMFEDEPAKDE